MPGTYTFLTPVQGVVQHVAFAAPAAGAQFTTTIPTTEMWRVTLVTFQFVTSAVVANRICNVRYSGAGVRPWWHSGETSTQAASLTRWYTFGIDAGADVGRTILAGTTVTCRLPDALSFAAGTLVIEVININATDQLSQIVVTYQLWRT